LLLLRITGLVCRLNADFEDHADHEYTRLVAEYSEWERPFRSDFAADYGSF
jgi:hypothetical protein